MAAAYENEDEGSSGGGPMFSPPLYQQRYSAVLEVARKHHPIKVRWWSYPDMWFV